MNKFLGTSKEIEIDGEKITINPLRVKDLPKISIENPTPEQAVKISKDMIKLSLGEVNITDEELDNISVENYTKLLSEINKLNGFVDENVELIRAARKNSK